MAMTIMPTGLHLLLLLFVMPFMGGRPRRDLVPHLWRALPGCARCVADESETAAEEERVWISLIKCLPPSRCCYYWPPTWRLCRGSTRTTASGSVCSSSIHGRREEDNVPHNLPPLAEPPMPPRLPSWCPIPGCLLCSRRTTIHFPRIRRCYTTGCSTT